MKKFTSLALCLALGLSLMAGCSSEKSDATEAPVAIGGQETVAGGNNGSADAGNESGEAATVEATMYDFVYNGVVVVPGTDPANVVDALGSYETFEAVSCAYQGTDYTYMYNDFVIRSTPNAAGENTIISVEISSDVLVTAEGAYVGMSQADIEAIYGAPTESLAGGLNYIDGNKELSIFLSDGVVTAINYTYIME